MRHARARLFQFWEVVFAEQEAGSCLEPVVRKYRLHLANDRSGDAHLRFAPKVFGVRVAQPAVGDAHATGETNLAIDDEQLPMRTVVDVRLYVPPVLTAILEKLHASLAQLLAVAVVELECAHAIDKGVNFHPGTRALGQRFDEEVADVA